MMALFNQSDDTIYRFCVEIRREIRQEDLHRIRQALHPLDCG